jgi:hypothetical protein
LRDGPGISSEAGKTVGDLRDARLRGL